MQKTSKSLTGFMLILMLLLGISMTIVLWWITIAFDYPKFQMVIALSFFAGVVIGGWGIGTLMFCFAQNIASDKAEEAACHAVRIMTTNIQDFPRNSQVDVELIPQAEPLITGDCADDINIESDPDWWKDEEKRRRVKKRQN